MQFLQDVNGKDRRFLRRRSLTAFIKALQRKEINGGPNWPVCKQRM